MKVLVQRVLEAQVTIDSNIHSSIDKGLLIYICFETGDDDESIERAIKKIMGLRIFEDSNSKMNLNINQVNHQILVVSQFTLSWSGQKGNRPSFENSMPPDKANLMYESFFRLIDLKLSSKVNSGIFGADMKVSSINDGPITFFLSF